MFEWLGRQSSVMFVVSGVGVLLAGVAILFTEILGPGPVVWALPALGLAVGAVAGAGAFAGLRIHLGADASRLATTSAVVALVTAAMALAASVGGILAAVREQLPAALTGVALVLALLGFVGTGLLVSVAALRTAALPRRPVGVLLVACALTLVAPVAARAAGSALTVLLVVLAAWALALLGMGRAVPRQA